MHAEIIGPEDQNFQSRGCVASRRVLDTHTSALDDPDEAAIQRLYDSDQGEAIYAALEVRSTCSEGPD